VTGWAALCSSDFQRAKRYVHRFAVQSLSSSYYQKVPSFHCVCEQFNQVSSSTTSSEICDKQWWLPAPPRLVCRFVVKLGLASASPSDRKISDFHGPNHAARQSHCKMNQSYWRDGLYDVETEEWLTVLRCNELVDTRSSDCDTDTKSDEFELPIGCGRRLGEALLCATRGWTT
jgi:hypothetical protein